MWNVRREVENCPAVYCVFLPSLVTADPLAVGREAAIAELFHPGRCTTGRVRESLTHVFHLMYTIYTCTHVQSASVVAMVSMK